MTARADRSREQVRPLYPQLKGGRRREGAPTLEQVAADQRARLCGAMVEAAAEVGYAVVTVRHLCALAGVSSSTLYKLFPGGKEECFVKVYDAVMKGVARRVADAHLDESAGERRLAHAFEVFACEVAARPRLARLAMVEALGAGPVVLERVERTHRLFEAMVRIGLEGRDREAPPPLVVKGIVAGVARVARVRVLEDRGAELVHLGEPLLEWALCYCSPAAERLSSSGGPGGALSWRPPRARRGGEPADERTLILRAAAQLAVLEGAATLSAAEIANASGVALQAFEQELRDPRRCVLEAFEMLTGQALALTLAAGRSGETWQVGVHRAMAALTRHIASNPVFARLAFVEIFATGAEGVEARERLLGSFARALWASAPGEVLHGGIAAEAAVGAVWGILRHHVVGGAAHTLPRAAGHLSYMVLTPAVGAEEAVETVIGELARAGGEPETPAGQGDHKTPSPNS